MFIFKGLLLDVSADITAWATLALALFAFMTIIVQIWWNRRIINEARRSSDIQAGILVQQLKDQNEIAFKHSSVQLADSFQRELNELMEDRATAAQIILENELLTKQEFEYEILEDLLEDVYDFFDTVGFFVRRHYMKEEVAHQYFDHWFSHYFKFYELYQLKPARYGVAVWNNLKELWSSMERIEIEQTGLPHTEITKDKLKEFFAQEAEIEG